MTAAPVMEGEQKEQHKSPLVNCVNSMGPPTPVVPGTDSAKVPLPHQQHRADSLPSSTTASSSPDKASQEFSNEDQQEDNGRGSGGGGSGVRPGLDYCDSRVRVICRFREYLEEDYDGRGSSGDWLYFDGGFVDEGGGGDRGGAALQTVSVRMGSAWSRRAFDEVFRPGADQSEVYEAVELVAHGVAQGFNGTIFAYGQTGSGKTYTMGGAADASFHSVSSQSAAGYYHDDQYNPSEQRYPHSEALGTAASTSAMGATAASRPPDGGGRSCFASDAGVIPRAVASVLADANARREQGWEYVLTATYVEIYNEKIRDLLNPANDNLKVSEHPSRGVEAVGALEVRVSTVEEAIEVLRAGAAHRMTAATLMNQTSSRSHSIFTLRLDQRDVVRDCKVAARLTLVDLAGSERAAKTGAEGKRLEEANSINVSLHTLGRVIRALSENAGHVPFRDSKLTRLLQESLGGNSRTVLIVCCSPAESQAPETLSTLKFGECAKRVSTFASANVVAAPNEVAAQLSQLRAEVIRLKRQVHDYRLRDARRMEGGTPTAPNRYPRRGVSAGVRAGFLSPGTASVLSPTRGRGSRSAARAERGNAPRGHGGSGPLRQNSRWSTPPSLSRAVSFSGSYGGDDMRASSDDESWGGTTPREWEKETITSWSASAPAAPGVAADAPSPSSTVAGQMPTGWRATARIEPPDSPFVAMAITPTVSPDATPMATTPSRKKGSSRRRKSVGAWAPAPPAPPASVERPSERRRMWVDLERPLPSPPPPLRQQRWQREQAVGEVEGVEGEEEVGAVGIDGSVLRSSSAAEAAAAAGLAAAAVERAAVTAIAGEGERAGGGDRNGGGVVLYDEDAMAGMNRLRARVVCLEKSYEEREAMYEKLLQLKDLRIQSLTSVYQNSSASFREAVNAKLPYHQQHLHQHKLNKPASSPTTTESSTTTIINEAAAGGGSGGMSAKSNRTLSRTPPRDGNTLPAPMHGGEVVAVDGNSVAGVNEDGIGSGGKRSSRKKRGGGTEERGVGTGVEREGGRQGTVLLGMLPSPPPAPPSSPRASETDVWTSVTGAAVASRHDGAMYPGADGFDQ